MSPRQLRQKLIRTESQIIANEMMLAALCQYKARVFESTRLDSCFPLALALSAQIQTERLAGMALKADHQSILHSLSNR